MRILLQLNNFMYDKEKQEEMKIKNIEYEDIIRIAYGTLIIDNIDEIRHFEKTIDLIINDEVITIETKYIRYMEIK